MISTPVPVTEMTITLMAVSEATTTASRTNRQIPSSNC